jgi:sensor histidine kinase regulating citrate/malate metabolism
MFLFNVIVLGLLFTGTGFYYLNMYGQNLNDNLLDKSRLLIKMYKSIIVQDIVNYNDIALLYHIEKIESIDDINYAVIVDSHSTILAHSDVYEIGKTYNDPLTEWTTNVKIFRLDY